MKKYLSIIALATLAIVGCGKVNLDQSAQDEETPISFQALSYVSQTKADHEHIALPKGAQFDILAYFTDGDITNSGTSKYLYFKDIVSNSVKSSEEPTEWIWKTDTTYYEGTEKPFVGA